jgi:hypothetical protein
VNQLRNAGTCSKPSVRLDESLWGESDAMQSRVELQPRPKARLRCYLQADAEGLLIMYHDVDALLSAPADVSDVQKRCHQHDLVSNPTLTEGQRLGEAGDPQGIGGLEGSARSDEPVAISVGFYHRHQSAAGAPGSNGRKIGPQHAGIDMHRSGIQHVLLPRSRRSQID